MKVHLLFLQGDNQMVSRLAIDIPIFLLGNDFILILFSILEFRLKEPFDISAELCIECLLHAVGRSTVPFDKNVFVGV